MRHFWARSKTPPPALVAVRGAREKELQSEWDSADGAPASCLRSRWRETRKEQLLMPPGPLHKAQQFISIYHFNAWATLSIRMQHRFQWNELQSALDISTPPTNGILDVRDTAGSTSSVPVILCSNRRCVLCRCQQRIRGTSITESLFFIRLKLFVKSM